MPGCIQTAVLQTLSLLHGAALVNGVTHPPLTLSLITRHHAHLLLSSLLPQHHEIFKSQRYHPQRASPPDHSPHIHSHCSNRPPPVVPRIPALSLELVPLPPGLISPSICATTRAAFIKQKSDEVTPFRCHHLISPSPLARNTCRIEFKFLDAYKYLTFGFYAFYA